MAKDICPNCNKPVSNTAFRCEHCGFDLNLTRYCPECGALVKEDAETCPQCGCAMGEEEAPNPKIKWIVLGVVLAVLVLAAGIIFYGVQKNQKSAAYYDIIDEVISTKAQSVGMINDCAYLLMDVWEDAILQEKDARTEAFTCPDGTFVKDYNTALNNLYEDEEFARKIELLNQNQDKMLALRDQLETPPKGEEAYNGYVISLIDNYVDSASFVLTPSGSIFEAKERFKQLVKEADDISNQLNSFAN